MSELTTRRNSSLAVWHAVRTAAGLLQTRWFTVLIAMVCVQGVLVWSMPFLVALVRWTLRRVGITGVNLYTLDTLVSSPLAVVVLVTVAVVATVLVLAETTLFAVIGHLVLDGKQVTFIGVLSRARDVARKMAGWQGLLLVPAIISGSEDTIVQSLVRSLRQTRWRALLGFSAVMLGTALIAWLVRVLLGGLGLAPVAVARSHTAAGIVLGLLTLAQFLVAGAATAFVSFFFVAYVRSAQDRPIDVPTAGPFGRRTRAVAAVIVILAVLNATPQMVAATAVARSAGQTSPEIIGHRGYPARAVENSVAGLSAADAAGADMVAMDSQETRDGGLVVMHDGVRGRLPDR